MSATLISTLLILQVAGSPASAAAQARPAAAPMIETTGLPTVFLTDLRGVEHRGRLIRVDPEEVVMVSNGGERTFKRAEVVQIEKRGDSLKNGALIGAAVGLLGGIGSLSVADCPQQKDGCPGARAALFGAMVGVYSAIGTGIDAAIQGRTLLYRAPAVTLSLQPSRAVAGLTIRW